MNKPMPKKKKKSMLHETDKCLEKYSLPKLIQEETENLNNPIANKGMEFIIKSFPPKKPPDPDIFTGKIYYIFKDIKI